MIGLATVARLRADEIWTQADEVMVAVEHGTLITVVWGVKTLAAVATTRSEYRVKIFPFLMNILNTCNPRDLTMHAESIFPAIGPGNREEFLSILERRKEELKPAQQARLKKVIKKMKT